MTYNSHYSTRSYDMSKRLRNSKLREHNKQHTTVITQLAPMT
jgi:hypothetical protein